MAENKKETTTPPVMKITNDIVNVVMEKIEGAESILVALSNDPSVDEMAAAIGLTMLLDNAGKNATAIYSGQTPNALEFLEPGKTFEKNTNSLRDFIIALNRDKADSLHYREDGGYVKIFIRPYRMTLSEADLEFSHGDYNVDLVIALDVSSVGELDGALNEYGRIAHDATSINITTGVPGKFGEVEWNDPGASSICEMITGLVISMKEKLGELKKEEATALLTGIISATERFSNARTTPNTMALAAKLMMAGADQQLIASNIEKKEVPTGVVDGMGMLSVRHDDAPVNNGDANMSGAGAGGVANAMPSAGGMAGMPVAEAGTVMSAVNAGAGTEVAMNAMPGAGVMTGAPIVETGTVMPAVNAEEQNPAMMAAPEAKIDNNDEYIPTISYIETEPSGMGVIEPTKSGEEYIAKSGKMNIINPLSEEEKRGNDLTGELIDTASVKPSTMTAQEALVAMPMVQAPSGGVDLPLPPAPPIDPAMMPPAVPMAQSGAEVIQPAVPSVDNNTVIPQVAKDANLVMQDQVYPVNPADFRIPGM